MPIAPHLFFPLDSVTRFERIKAEAPKGKPLDDGIACTFV
jgi:hypothetical protein